MIAQVIGAIKIYIQCKEVVHSTSLKHEIHGQAAWANNPTLSIISSLSLSQSTFWFLFFSFVKQQY